MAIAPDPKARVFIALKGVTHFVALAGLIYAAFAWYLSVSTMMRGPVHAPSVNLLGQLWLISPLLIVLLLGLSFPDLRKMSWGSLVGPTAAAMLAVFAAFGAYYLYANQPGVV